MDVLEIDGASNTGVDDIRELREQVKYVPLQGRYKVYIIDEVHMLSNAAFNALLKTLEEPPPHLLFIFATTEAQKILPTILSRCQHFHFKRVGRVELIAQIKRIAVHESISVDERALSLVAKASEGSVRDALSIIDQVTAYGGPDGAVREEDVVALLGVVDREGFATLTEAIRAKDAARAITAARSLFDHGHDVKWLCAELVEYVRNLTMAKLGGDPQGLIDLPDDEVAELVDVSAGYESDELQRLFEIFSQAQEEIRVAFAPPFALEMALVKATRVVALEPIERLVERVESLRGGSGEESLPRVRPPAPPSARVSQEPAPPPSETSAPTAQVSTPRVDPDVEMLWERMVSRALHEKPNLGSYLQAGHVTGPRPNEVVLEYGANHAVFGDMVSKEENLAYVVGLLRELGGKEMTFRVRALPKSMRDESRSSERNEIKTSRRQRVSEVLAHPSVKEALDVFGGEVMEVRDITPPSV